MAALQSGHHLDVSPHGLRVGPQNPMQTAGIRREGFLHEHVDALADGVLHVDRPNVGSGRAQGDVAGMQQVDELLGTARKRLLHLTHPALVVVSDNDQVVDPEGSDKVYEKIGSASKELLRISSSRHNIIYGNGATPAARVRQAICSFIIGNTR